MSLEESSAVGIPVTGMEEKVDNSSDIILEEGSAVGKRVLRMEEKLEETQAQKLAQQITANGTGSVVG